MTKEGGLRMATANGAILADAASLGELLKSAGERLFDPEFWRQQESLEPVIAGRGAAWFVSQGSRAWVLRHYRRGGFVARFFADGYLWAGEARVRAFAEFRLLEALSARAMPVPRPIAAHYRREGLAYRCDILIERIQGAVPLSAVLKDASPSDESWRAIGAAVAALHREGVDHADLNAHNILIGGERGVSVIDFDRGRLRRPGHWMRRNLERLRRSLEKISAAMPPGRFSDAAWRELLRGYESQGASD